MPFNVMLPCHHHFNITGDMIASCLPGGCLLGLIVYTSHHVYQEAVYWDCVYLTSCSQEVVCLSGLLETHVYWTEVCTVYH